MLPLVAEMQKVPQLACYSVKLMSNSIFNGEETIKASISLKFCHLQAIRMIFCV